MRLGATSLSVTRPGSVRKYTAAGGGGASNTNFDDISNYSHVRFDQINTGSLAVVGIEFNNTGTTMWTVDTGSSSLKYLRQQTLSTAWDISTAGSQTAQLNLVAGNPSDFSNPREVRIKPDGFMLWVCDFYSVIREYTLTTAFDLAGGISNTGSKTMGGRLGGFVWKPDGTALFTIDYSTDKIKKYEFATAWDIESTVTSTTESPLLSLSTTANEGNAQSLAFSPDGLKVYFAGTSGDKIYMYNLGTAWDITSSSLSGTPDDTLSVSSQETNPLVITFSSDGKHLYVGGSQGDGVDQYSRP